MKKAMLLGPAKYALTIAIAMMSAMTAYAQEHPAYLHALSDLRAARWLIDHRPGNWQQNADEAAAVQAIDAAINEIKRAAIDDGKNINDHPQVPEIQDRAGRIQKALDMLHATRNDINQREDDRWAQGLKGRALRHVDDAINAAQRAVAAGHQGAHPAYLQALSDLRAARWMFTNRPGNWQQTQDEIHAVQEIEAAINEIQKAAIDDGKNINDHPAVQEIPDRAGRIQKAIEMLKATSADLHQREDDGFAQGLRGRAIGHIDHAVMDAQQAIAQGHQGAHPAYMQALSDLRAARWMFTNRPANWQQTQDEIHAVQAIEAAIGEIQKAAIDDGKNINDHPQVQEIPDRAGRIQKAIDILNATRNDVNQREDDGFAQGLKGRALQHIDEAIRDARQALAAPTLGAHPAYLQALSDLRAARWMFTNRPANWQQTQDEIHAVQAIEAAIGEIQKAAIDDGKNINDHPQVQEIPDRAGRIQKAIDMLNATRNDVNQREDDGYAQGLKSRALQHIDEAIRDARQALAAPTLGAHPAYLQALADLRGARWLIDHRPGGWPQSPFEANAVKAIDAAIKEINKAAIDDGKNINDHTQVQEIPDRGGRMHRAMDMLRNTRKDVSQREDDGYAQGLKGRALQHIDDALRSCQQAIDSY